MLSLHILPRIISYNLKQLTKQLHMSVKLMIPHDSSSSDSSSDSSSEYSSSEYTDSDSEGNNHDPDHSKKNLDIKNPNENLEILLTALTKKSNNLNSKSNYLNKQNKNLDIESTNANLKTLLSTLVNKSGNTSSKLKNLDQKIKKKVDIKFTNENLKTSSTAFSNKPDDAHSESNNLKQQNKQNMNIKSTNENLEKLLTSMIKNKTKIDSYLNDDEYEEKKSFDPKYNRFTVMPKKIPYKNKSSRYVLEEKLKISAAKIASTIGNSNQNVESDLLRKSMTIMNDDKSKYSHIRKVKSTSKGAFPTNNEHSIFTNENEKESFLYSELKPSGTDRLEFISQLTQTTEINKFVPRLSTWDLVEEKELNLQIIAYPDNPFQEMIEWTEKGMLWHFPINNEQGMEKEEKVHFSEHIFLERHLKDWCPKKGQLRHFMELVCVGLSKNPYMTVEEKIEHITWYKDYFKDKMHLLERLEDNIINTLAIKNVSEIEP